MPGARLARARRAPPIAPTLLLALLLGPCGPGAAQAAPAPWEGLLEALAAPAPTARAEAARKAGAAWPDGARAAPALARLVADDPDPAVRTASEQALAALTARGLLAWLELLAGPAAAPPEPFTEVASTVVALGTKVQPVDFAAGLGAEPKDASQAAVLAAVPLLWTLRTVEAGLDRVTLEVLLLERAVAAGPATRRLALAGLPLLASAGLRDGGRPVPEGAPGAVPPARWTALLGDPRLHVRALALGLLGSAAPAEAGVVAALAAHAAALAAAPGDSAAQAYERQAAVLAVRRLGTAAAPAAPALRALRKLGTRGAIQAQVRIGVTEGLYPESLESFGKLVLNRTDDAMADVAYLHEFLDVVEALAETDPAQAAKAREALGLLLGSIGTQPKYGSAGARVARRVLRLLPRLGPSDGGRGRLLQSLAEAPSLGSVQHEAVRTRALLGHGTEPLLAQALAQLRGERSEASPLDPNALPGLVNDLAATAARQGPLPEAVRQEADPGSPAVRGALAGLASAPERAAAAAPWALTVLLRTFPRLGPLSDGTFLRALVDSATAPGEPRPSTLADLLETRRLALSALAAAGAAAAPDPGTLELLRRDVDTELRWRARRLLAR